MRVGRTWAALWLWLIAAAASLFVQAQPAWAADAAPASSFADVPVTPKPKPTATVIRAGPSHMTLADRAAAERAGPPGTGKSNLACMVFEGRTGVDARSTLYNRCGSGVRLNYCLQYKNGADNCLPGILIDDEGGTVWDLLSGQSLVMPATDILKRWSVFACEYPLTPWRTVFVDRDLVGACVEKGLEPPPGAAAPHPTIRSNDPTTWPPGTINMTCISVSPVLVYFQMQLVNHCDRKINIAICATTYIQNGSWPCIGDVPEPIGPPTWAGSAIIELLPRPSAIIRWAAFACFDPEIPRHVHYDGSKLVADCVGPEVDTATALPRRAANKATERISEETTDEDVAERERKREEASQAIDAERSRVNANANNLLGVITDAAVTTAQTYATAKAQQQQQQQQQEMLLLQQHQEQQQQEAAQRSYSLPPSSTPSSSVSGTTYSSVSSHTERPVTSAGAPCGEFKPISHTFPVGTAGRFERYDYQLTNVCGVPVTFVLGFSDGSSLEESVGPGVSRGWFCTVGFWGNDDCVGGVKTWTYR